MRFFIVTPLIKNSIYLTYDTKDNRFWGFPHMRMPEHRTSLSKMTWYKL